MKRYAIVRVDDNCPSGHDGCKVNLVCVQDRKNIKEKTCKNCLYGDTKEQLEKKIAQVMLRKWLKGYLGTAMKPKIAQEQIEIVYKVYLGLAKEIVEFLGIRG